METQLNHVCRLSENLENVGWCARKKYQLRSLEQKLSMVSCVTRWSLRSLSLSEGCRNFLQHNTKPHLMNIQPIHGFTSSLEKRKNSSYCKYFQDQFSVTNTPPSVPQEKKNPFHFFLSQDVFLSFSSLSSSRLFAAFRYHSTDEGHGKLMSHWQF